MWVHPYTLTPVHVRAKFGNMGVIRVSPNTHHAYSSAASHHLPREGSYGDITSAFVDNESTPQRKENCHTTPWRECERKRSRQGCNKGLGG